MFQYHRDSFEMNRHRLINLNLIFIHGEIEIIYLSFCIVMDDNVIMRETNDVMDAI